MRLSNTTTAPEPLAFIANYKINDLKQTAGDRILIQDVHCSTFKYSSYGKADVKLTPLGHLEHCWIESSILNNTLPKKELDKNNRYLKDKSIGMLAVSLSEYKRKDNTFSFCLPKPSKFAHAELSGLVKYSMDYSLGRFNTSPAQRLKLYRQVANEIDRAINSYHLTENEKVLCSLYFENSRFFQYILKQIQKLIPIVESKNKEILKSFGALITKKGMGISINN